MSVIDELRQRVSPEVREGEPMAKHTTFKIGGPARYFWEAKSADDAVKAVAAAGELGLPYFVLGGGSNMLVSDEGVKGLVIKMADRGFRIEGERVIAEAGAPTGLISQRAADAGLAGFEWAAGIPGTIGGAVRGNAGAYGGEMKDAVETVRLIKDGIDATMTGAECGFSYRDSVFKRHPGWIVLAATLKFRKSADPEAAKARIREMLLDRKKKQPVEYPCAGCIFANWKPSGPEDLEALRGYFDLGKDERIPVTIRGTVPAGWIIDRARLKGTRVGSVMISEKHGNFFIHEGKATADEVVRLIAAVKTKVRNLSHGIVQLQEEVEYAGF